MFVQQFWKDVQSVGNSPPVCMLRFLTQERGAQLWGNVMTVLQMYGAALPWDNSEIDADPEFAQPYVLDAAGLSYATVTTTNQNASPSTSSKPTVDLSVMRLRGVPTFSDVIFAPNVRSMMDMPVAKFAMVLSHTKSSMNTPFECTVLDIPDMWPPLCIAAYDDNVPLVQFLIENGANLDGRTHLFQWAPVMICALFGCNKTLGPLLAAAAPCNAVDALGRAALSMCAEARQYPRQVRLLGGILQGQDNTAMVQSRRFDVAQQLVAAGATVDLREKNGSTALSLAIQNTHKTESMVRLLLDAGADVNNVDGEMTALMMAVRYQCSLELLQMLVARGAEVNCELTRAVTIGNRDLRQGETALTIALQSMCDGIVTDAVVMFLLHSGANPNAGPPQCKPLHIVAGAYCDESRSIDIVRTLIRTGANIDFESHLKRTALHEAVDRQKEGIVALLLAAGADVHARDGDNHSALLIAIHNDNEAIAIMLVAAGSTLDDEVHTAIVALGVFAADRLAQLQSDAAVRKASARLSSLRSQLFRTNGGAFEDAPLDAREGLSEFLERLQVNVVNVASVEPEPFGSGNSAVVYDAVLDDGVPVALKVLRPRSAAAVPSESSAADEMFKNELRALWFLEEKGRWRTTDQSCALMVAVARLPDGCVGIAMERFNDSLSGWITEAKQTQWHAACGITTVEQKQHVRVACARDCATAVSWLHNYTMVHCDIAPRNFLHGGLLGEPGEDGNVGLHPTMVVKLTDFGLSGCMDRNGGYTPLCGALPVLRAPELEASAPVRFTLASDVWSLALVLTAVLGGAAIAHSVGNDAAARIRPSLALAADAQPLQRPAALDLSQVFAEAAEKAVFGGADYAYENENA